MERMKTQVELLKESCDIKDAACVRYQKRIAELEEENKKLRKECEENDYLVEDNARWMKKCEEKTMEIKKLKSDLAFERTMLDNVRAEYESLQNVIKNLKEEVRFLEGCLDRKEKLNEKYRKEIEELKSTYVYDAKQVRDIC
jgi:chromosome segregation ATPase